MLCRNRINISVFLVSFSVFLYQVCLLRIISLSDYYHFAFLIISIALMGFGISGSSMYFFTRKIKERSLLLSVFAATFTVSIFLSYLLINRIPFDSFKIAWEARQIFYLLAYYFSLLLPFFFGGSFIGYVFYGEEKPGVTYFYNLIGSAAGSIIFLFLVQPVGKIGVILVSIASGIASTILVLERRHIKIFSAVVLVFIIAVVAVFLFFPAFLDIRMSPYKSLPALLRIPESEILYSAENNYAKVDVIESSSIKSYPGLSLKFPDIPPEQLGITVDGNNLSPITKVGNKNIPELDFLNYMPVSVIFKLISEEVQSKDMLIIEPGGGLDVLACLYFNQIAQADKEPEINLDKENYNISNKKLNLDSSACNIYILENNNLVTGILKNDQTKNGFFVNYSGKIYKKGNVSVIETSSRNFASTTSKKFDLIVLSLADSFHPISSGAYSLNENYLYTEESFSELIKLLSNNGVLAITRWIQIPPSEGLKVISTIAESCRNLEIPNLPEKVFAFRSWSTITVLFKKDGFMPSESKIIKNELKELNFDLVYSKDAIASETNTYNQLNTTDYYDYFKRIIEGSTKERADLYKDYYFNIEPSTDNRPYFYDYFKFRQVPDIIKYFGKSTQPFGGGGYLILVTALIIAIVLSLLFVILPLRIRRINLNIRTDYRFLIYFLALGFGFFFVELPFIQKFILVLGKPSYSLSVVLFSLLLSAGFGSFIITRIKLDLKWVVLIIVIYILLFIFLSRQIQEFIIAKSLWQRFFYTALLIVPLGFFMGIPFPAGIVAAKKKKEELIPWLWAVNGCASVIGSITAVIISIHLGFLVVVGIAAVLYVVAYVAYRYF